MDDTKVAENQETIRNMVNHNPPWQKRPALIETSSTKQLGRIAHYSILTDMFKKKYSGTEVL